MKEETKGVFLNKLSDGSLSYRASFTFRRKHISLGSFQTKEEASLAYQTALRLVNEPNLSLDDFQRLPSSLPLEKWVSILNFRDNALYIRTPIYLKKSFFFYYLSIDNILKFDADDLFFYSNHKIQKRGGHLFVTDYGMQINLLSRYGIRSFAVPGKDYIFINGDELDFRYSNLKIINRYYGVSLERKLPKPLYLSKININGSVIIGRYESEEEAALAYNKAVDLLFKAGFKKKYEKNYIDGSGREELRSKYESLPLNRRLLKIISSLKDQANSRKEVH